MQVFSEWVKWEWLLLLSTDLFRKTKIFLAFVDNLSPIQQKKAKYVEVDENPRKLFKYPIIKTRLVKDFLIINSKLSKSDMIALNKKNYKLFLPFVQHDGFPEDGEDAYKE